jgi:hypothetical protein
MQSEATAVSQALREEVAGLQSALADRTSQLQAQLAALAERSMAAFEEAQVCVSVVGGWHCPFSTQSSVLATCWIRCWVVGAHCHNRVGMAVKQASRQVAVHTSVSHDTPRVQAAASAAAAQAAEEAEAKLAAAHAATAAAQSDAAKVAQGYKAQVWGVWRR